jgi:hypothetical protein
MGRFDAQRWRRVYEDLFHKYELVHNRRSIAKIEVSAQADGAIAVVDIDTLWRDRATGDESNHWLGRTCKAYALVAGEWTMTMQTGALQYQQPRPAARAHRRTQPVPREEPRAFFEGRKESGRWERVNRSCTLDCASGEARPRKVRRTPVGETGPGFRVVAREPPRPPLRGCVARPRGLGKNVRSRSRSGGPGGAMTSRASVQARR